MNPKFGALLLVQLLIVSTRAMQDCGKDAQLTDGGVEYDNIEDCKSRCYCRRGSGGDVLEGKMSVTHPSSMISLADGGLGTAVEGRAVVFMAAGWVYWAMCANAKVSRCSMLSI
jgi:hypothetical protein